MNRSSLYYEPVEPDAEKLALMCRMDELHLKHPFFWQPHDDASAQSGGAVVNRTRMQRLMRLMGLEIEHDKPFAVFRSHQERRLRLLCKRHNRFTAERFNGRVHSAQDRRKTTTDDVSPTNCFDVRRAWAK